MYAHTAVMQAHSVGMHYARHQIAEALKAVLGDSLQNIYYKSEATLPYKANLGSEDGYLYGGEVEDIALENGLKFCVDWQKGQKTGFFVDQRENRSLLERYAKGRSVLNMFCYTGGFSFYAMRGGAKVVHSVDRSAKAQTERHRFRKDQARRYPVHLLLLAGGKQRKLPSGRIQCCRPVRAQCPHPAPTDTTRRPSGQHLPSGRGISERAGTLCRVRRGMNYEL